MSFIGISIIVVIVLIAMCSRSFATAGYAEHDRWAMALGLFTLVTSLALGIGAGLFFGTYETGAYYGSFYLPLLVFAGVMLVSLVGLIIRAILLYEAWRAGGR